MLWLIGKAEAPVSIFGGSLIKSFYSSETLLNRSVTYFQEDEVTDTPPNSETSHCLPNVVFLPICYFQNYVYLYVRVCAHECRYAQWPAEGIRGTRGGVLELQVVVSILRWVLGTELVPFYRSYNLF